VMFATPRKLLGSESSARVGFSLLWHLTLTPEKFLINDYYTENIILS
jgi:hypothetical protein